MATAGYRLAAALAVLIVAGTTAAGWHRGRTTGTAPAVVPVASPSGGASQPARPTTSLELTMPGARATQDVAATPTLLSPATMEPGTQARPLLPRPPAGRSRGSGLLRFAAYRNGLLFR